MKLRRCPSCKGYTDDLDSPRCFACGAELPREARDTAPRFRPPRLDMARKDKKISTGLLAVFAVFGGIGALSIVAQREIDPLLRGGLIVFMAVAALLGVLSMAGVKNPTVSALGRPMLKLFAFFGLLIVGGMTLAFGVVLLMFLACAIGGGFR